MKESGLTGERKGKDNLVLTGNIIQESGIQ